MSPPTGNFRALPRVYFFKDYDIKEPETVKISSQGKFAASIDRKIFFAGEPPEITLPAGRHTLKIAVFNYEKIPAIRVDGPSVKSDRSWRVKIDRANAEFEEVERARGLPITRAATDYGFCGPDNPPAKFELPRREIKPAKTEKSPGKIFSDFGEETFGFVKFKVCAAGAPSPYTTENPRRRRIPTNTVKCSGNIPSTSKSQRMSPCPTPGVPLCARGVRRRARGGRNVH